MQQAAAAAGSCITALTIRVGAQPNQVSTRTDFLLLFFFSFCPSFPCNWSVCVTLTLSHFCDLSPPPPSHNPLVQPPTFFPFGSLPLGTFRLPPIHSPHLHLIAPSPPLPLPLPWLLAPRSSPRSFISSLRSLFLLSSFLPHHHRDLDLHPLSNSLDLLKTPQSPHPIPQAHQILLTYAPSYHFFQNDFAR